MLPALPLMLRRYDASAIRDAAIDAAMFSRYAAAAIFTMSLPPDHVAGRRYCYAATIRTSVVATPARSPAADVC